MLIDNKQYPQGNSNGIQTVWDFIHYYTNPANRQGSFDIATGFFSIAGLSLLYKELNPQNKYRIMLGEMASDDEFLNRVVDLLAGDSSIENAFQLSEYAQNAIAFLKQATVDVKKVNNAFCHAKAYSFTDNRDDAHDYAIMGSSNLTEAGLGTKATANVELNNAETGRNNTMVKEIKDWFKFQWNNVAQAKITIPLSNGVSQEKDVKKYLIEQIENIFKLYTPKDIYYKILFEFFREDIDAEDSLEHKRNMKLLKETKIWNTLFDYQQNGVISLVKLINRYNGAILADAVGLGKTFTALGVIRYFQNCGYDTLLLCPKKLGGNWEQYKHTHDSFLKDDHFEYIVRYHTDLQDNRMDKMDCTLQEIQKHQQLLLVIDESHNLRTHSSSRYKKLMEDIITYQNGRTRDVKVLLLSATPINNQLKDVRNQFNLIAGNYENSNEDAFNADFGIQSITNTFTHASKVYADWCERPNRTINTFREQLNDESFFNLTGKLIVARTRHFIQDKLGRDMHFPVKLPTKAICEGLNNIGHFKSIEEIYDKIKLLQLTAYQPTQYMYELPEPTREIVEEVKTLLDKIPGSHATLTIEHLIGKKDGKNIFTKYETVTYKVLPGMEPGFVDRLKDYVYDRWDGDIDLLPYSINTFAVKEAVRAAQEHDPELWQNNAYREMSLAAMMVVLFMKRLESSWDSCRSTANAVLKQHINWMKLAVANKDANAEGDSIDINIEDFTDDDVEEMIDGQATIGKRTVDFSKMLRYNDYLKALKQDIEILKDFVGALDDFGKAIAAGRQKDEKIEALIKELEEKQQKANKKVVIFTTYSDTAKYIYDCIKHSGKFRGYACVTGSATYINGETNDAGHDVEHKEFMHCLECFAPYTKLFMEKYWDDLFAKYNITSKNLETFQTWKAHVSEYDPRIAAQLNKEIDILIATDCLSEGQNLQDADTVINYDIHWNPVRLVQRYGRVDRIGSPNNEIQCVNFWPTASYENYLNLSKRITNRMLCMTIGGAEIIDDVNEKVKEMNADSKIRAQQEENALNAFNNNTYEELGESDGLDMANISLSEFKDDIVEFLSEQGDKFRKMPNGCFSGFRLNLDCYKDNITSDSIIAFVRNRVDTKKYHLLCLPVDGTPIAQEMSTEKILSVLKDTRHEDTLIETLQSFTADDFKNFSKTILKWFGSGTEYEIGDAVDKLLGDLKIEGPEQSIDEVLSPDNYDLIAWDYVKVDYNE